MPDPVRRLSVPPLAGLEGQRCGALGSGGVAVRLQHSFPLRTSTIQGSHLPAFVPPLVHQGGGAVGGHSGPCGQECGGACSSAFPQLLQLAFCCVEDLGVLETRHRSLDPQFVCGCVSLPHGDHPVCPALSSSGGLDGLHRPQGSLPTGPCPSGLSSLPAVCGSGQCLPVLCPLLRPFHCTSGLHTGHGSCFRHSPLLGIRLRWYLDDWLVQSSSRDSLLRDLRVVLGLCRELGIVVNHEKSHLVPSQVVQYLGVVIDSRSFRASPSSERVARLRSTADAFLSCSDPPASTWLSLLGILSSLSQLVPGGRLRVRSLQLCLHRSWDRGDQSVWIPWSQDCLRDLRWWLDLPSLSLGVSLA